MMLEHSSLLSVYLCRNFTGAFDLDFFFSPESATYSFLSILEKSISGKFISSLILGVAYSDTYIVISRLRSKRNCFADCLDIV